MVFWTEIQIIRGGKQHRHSFNGALSGTTQVSRYQEDKTNLNLWEQETASGISCAICKSEPHPREITTPASNHSVFYKLDALPATQPTASKHWRQGRKISVNGVILYSAKQKHKSSDLGGILLYTACVVRRNFQSIMYAVKQAAFCSCRTCFNTSPLWRRSV